MHSQRSFNQQLPPLRQSLPTASPHPDLDDQSNSSDISRQSDRRQHSSTSSIDIAPSAPAPRSSTTISAASSTPTSILPPDRSLSSQHNYLTTQPRGEAQPQDMYPNYSQQQQQYSTHHLAQPYGAIPGATQGRVLPSAQSAMLPPTYNQASYGASSLPGPSPYDNMQQAPTPASSNTLGSTMDATTFATTRGNYTFELRVEQQPQRARMCGFGDKDRRPITPPPCVRLVVKRTDTDEEVDVEKIDGAFFVLQVDLWDAEAQREVNVIRASSSAPTQSISTAVPMSFPPPPVSAYVDMGYSSQSFGMTPGYMYPHYMSQTTSNVMYTRNLIGSLTVNASLLKDLEGNLGYWFVLSDLSVRTEGWFRLRMTFIDVGLQGQNGGDTGLNRSRCPIMSSIFSEKFQVYSAKKFPGVIESTPLSKCFAQQGIKIPIRKDGKGDKNEDDD